VILTNFGSISENLGDISAGKCPFSSGKAVVDAVKNIHPTPAMKVGNVFPQPSGVRQMVTMPLGVQGIKFCLWVCTENFLSLYFQDCFF